MGQRPGSGRDQGIKLSQCYRRWSLVKRLVIRDLGNGNRDEIPLMMTSRERILAVLNREIPDRVPYFEITFSREVARKHTGENREFTEQEISKLFGRDNITYWVGPPVFAETKIGPDGTPWVGEGLLATEEDLEKMELPALDDEFFRPAVEFLKEKGDFAACAAISMGIDPTIKSMGFERFCLALYDNPQFVLRTLDRFTDWSAKAVEDCAELGFDFIWINEDIAWRNGPFFSPEVFAELLFQSISKVADAMKLPWIFHSDGNLMPIMDHLLRLGMNGLHPIEPLAMDAVHLKKEYGDRLVLVGNLDISILANGSPRQVVSETKNLIRKLGTDGAYIASSSSAIDKGCRPENVIAFSETIRKYGRYGNDGNLRRFFGASSIVGLLGGIVRR